MQVVLFSVRPQASIVNQTETEFLLGEAKESSAIMSFLKVVNFMKKKLDLEERERGTPRRTMNPGP